MTDTHVVNTYMEHFLHKILNPKSLCVFGTNNNLLTTIGSMQLRNIIAGSGLNDIYPVHPRLSEVQGYKAYKSVLDLPIVPDLAFLILPTKVVPKVLEECGQKGIKHAIITSGGFRESGPEGIELSREIGEIAKKYNISFIGPNCLGIFNGWFGYPEKKDSNFNTMWIYHIPKRGNISIASQSGTIAAQTAWFSNEIGVRIGKSISVGNEKNIDIVDCLEYFKEDPQTSVIGLYIEEIKRGRKFIKLAKEITLKKPIVAIYAGGTENATRSIMSHTGSIGGNKKIYEAVFKETGIIATNSIMDFLYYLRSLSQAMTNNNFPKGKRVGIITDSGGAGSMMTKSAELLGLRVPEFSDELCVEISKMLHNTASGNNPIDLTFDINFYNFFVKLPKLLIKSGEVDSLLIYGLYDIQEVLEMMEKSGSPVDDFAKEMFSSFYQGLIKPIQRIARKTSIPIYYIGPYTYKYRLYQDLISHDLPVFSMWDQPIKCLAMIRKYSEYRENFP